jgi:hypothetical protein
VHSSLIGKIEKARRYAQEPERIGITQLSASFRGENDEHVVSYGDGKWRCSCEFFRGWDVCCHTMAMERILRPMLPHSTGQEAELMGSEAAPAGAR